MCHETIKNTIRANAPTPHIETAFHSEHRRNRGSRIPSKGHKDGLDVMMGYFLSVLATLGSMRKTHCLAELIIRKCLTARKIFFCSLEGLVYLTRWLKFSKQFQLEQCFVFFPWDDDQLTRTGELTWNSERDGRV